MCLDQLDTQSEKSDTSVSATWLSTIVSGQLRTQGLHRGVTSDESFTSRSAPATIETLATVASGASGHLTCSTEESHTKTSAVSHSTGSNTNLIVSGPESPVPHTAGSTVELLTNKSGLCDYGPDQSHTVVLGSQLNACGSGHPWSGTLNSFSAVTSASE